MKFLRKLSTIAIVLLPLLLAVGCTRSQQSPGIRVVTTVGMIADAAKFIGGEHVQVVNLMGPGIDPHLYKASEGDVTRMAEADLILYGGLHLEGKMGEIFERMAGRIPSVAVGEAVPTSERLIVGRASTGVQYDPHIWFDLSLWKHVADTIAASLAALDSANAVTYKARAAAYCDSLDHLHEWTLNEALKIPDGKRVLVTAHDAFGYFSRAYGFEVYGLQGISTAAEAGTGDVIALADMIATRRIPAIFVESSVPPRTIEAVRAAVRARGFEVTIGGELYSDALGNPGTPEGTYFGMVRHNVRTIVHSLRGNDQHE